MNSGIQRVRILSLVLVSIMLIGFIPQAVWAGQAVQENEDIFPDPQRKFKIDWIYIFYDPTDEMMVSIAEGVNEILSYRLERVVMVPIDSCDMLDYWLMDEPWIAIYALNSDLQNVHFPDRNMTWRQFYQTLGSHEATQHIVGMGNTLSLNPQLKALDKNIYHSSSEQVDALLLLFYDLWTVTDVIGDRIDEDDDFEKARDALQAVALKVYGDNFNTFFERTVEPVNPVGEVDEVALAERTAKMWEEHAPTIQQTYYHMTDEGKLDEISEDDLPDDYSPPIKLSTAEQVSADDLILGEIPLLSALRGPIGEIIDTLLDVLGSGGSTVISIPSDLVETIKQLFSVIEPIIGIVKDFDAESPLKSIVNALANEFPFMEEFKDYLNIIMKALFNFRGDLGSILGIVGDIIQVLLPDSVPQILKDFIGGILDPDDGLWNAISSVVKGEKGVFDAILGFFTSSTLNSLLNRTLAADLGMTSGQISTLLPRVINFVESIIGFIVDGNFMDFLEKVGTDLLGSILSVTGLGDVVDKVMTVIQMVMNVVDLIDEFDTTTLMDIAKDMLNSIVGPSNIPGGIDDLAKNLFEAVKTVQESGSSDVSGFISNLGTILDSGVTGVDQEVKNIVRDVIALIAGFFNSGFDKSQLPDIFEIAEAIATEFLGSGVSDVIQAFNSALKPIMGIIAIITDKDALKQMISKTVNNFVSELTDVPSMVKNVLKFLDKEDVFSGIPTEVALSASGDLESILDTTGEIVGGVVSMVQGIKGQSFQGVMQALLMSAGSIIGSFPAFDDVPIDAVLKLLQSFFPEAFGLSKDDMPSSTEIINQILDMAEGLLSGVIDPDTLKSILEFFMDIKDIFTNGVKWLLGKVFDWLGGLINPVLEDIENSIKGLFEGLDDLLGFSGKIPVGLGDWSLFDFEYALGLRANFDIDLSPLFDMIVSMIFDAREIFSMDNIGDFFKQLFSFFEISPQFYAECGIGGFDTEKNALMKTMLETLGLKLSFEGSAKFVLNLFTFRNGQFDFDNFFKIVEWGLHIKIHIGKVFTLLDFLTAGVGGGALNAVASFLGLDMITVEVYFEIIIDIVKKAASSMEAEVSSLTLTIIFGVSVHIPIELIIVAITIDGTLEVILTFFQDFASPSPMKITLRLVFTIKVKFRFLMFSETATFTWEPGGPWDLSPSKGSDDYEEAGQGFDTDGDGLSDTYEDSLPGLDKTKADTDDDGANDKLEVQTMGTDYVNPDSDGDGLKDGEEWELGTNPMREDTDWDDVDDYKEVKVYGTDPLTQDSDGDGLTDAYEIYTKLDISNVTPTVTEVVIGGQTYNDRTDPLNPDTDGDGLLDGDEGPMGAYYGDPSLYNDTEDESTGWAMDPNPLIFNGGFTHPLDADTDDDSALQLYNGVVDSQAYLFLKDMNDGAEVAGFWIILYDDEGEPENKQVFTNPCNPDTDGDTGITDRTPQPGAWINSDGYELAQTPPTDPTDGDTDDDGLLDGLEGVLSQYSNHTSATDPDTDDDGLFDMQEILLGTDPRRQDTDFDMISDGDEFYLFFTNPNVDDTDFDGLSDGEEVYFWHTNPLIDDSDADKLLDGDEVLMYGSDPMDEDGDNDGLTDFEEIMVYYTDAFDYDSDDDGLSDGEEIELYGCDPLVWDTDHDSITEPNENGSMTFPLNDYSEVMIYHTNVTDADSDQDGLRDGIELYLGSGLIKWENESLPWFINDTYIDGESRLIIPVDPLNKDTDGDLIADGTEMSIVNVSGLIYPFRAMTLVFRYNTSPCDADTDNDILTDYQEALVFNSQPDVVDTDNDTLTDWWEIWVYNTSALYNDTDGDELPDNEEVLTEVWPYGPWPPSNWSTGMGTEEGLAEVGSNFAIAEDHPIIVHAPALAPLYPTSATDPDCDDDYLPDGAEVNFYHTNPLDEDTNHDGTPDTLAFDTDLDGLEDGVEFMLKLNKVGGIFDPDSDNDGILDGLEYYVYGTDPANSDSDGDGLPDGYEIATGSNPNSYTSLTVLAPSGTLAPAVPVLVEVLNYTALESVWWRYGDGTTWSTNTTLAYNPTSHRWIDESIILAAGTYEYEVFGRDYNATEFSFSGQFTVAAEGAVIPIGPKMVIMTPVNGTLAYQDTELRVQNLTAFNSMWYRYRVDGTWSSNYSLTYNGELKHWYNDSITWDPGEYELQVFGMTPDGTEYMSQVTFVVPTPPGEFPWLLVLGIAVGLFGLTILTYTFWWRKRGGKAAKPGKPAARTKKKEPTKTKTTKKETSSKKSTKKKTTDTKEGGA